MKGKNMGKTAGYTNKRFGTIFNNDINNIMYSMSGKETEIGDYLAPVYAILDSKPGIFAQNVGMPEAVIYKTKVDSTFDKYYVDVAKVTWPEDESYALLEREVDSFRAVFGKDTDPLTLTIKACRERGSKIVASYRMNAEDMYQYTWMLSDFGRAHPEWRMKGKTASGEDETYGCLDPAIPGVYAHRMDIFTEAAENYDIDGLEFDFRRWTHMISEPLKNYPILTQMIRDTRKMLDRVSKEKGRDRMILGVRVGPTIADIGRRFDGTTPGSEFTDTSCKELGLDVAEWIEEEIADYICPSLFWPRWPGLPDTSQFAVLAEGKNIGIYPTLFPLPAWLGEEGPFKGPINIGDIEKFARYRNEFCDLVLRLYKDGADGISTFNWFFHLRKANVNNLWIDYYGYGPAGEDFQAKLLAVMGDLSALKKAIKADFK
jgi:hypothetical protein